MTFRELYMNLPEKDISPKQKFINDIVDVTVKAEGTVRAWITGSQKPDALTQRQIAEYIGKPAEELFPND